MRALVVTNMWPSDAAPQRGVFVRDQVEALRRRPGVEVEVFAFPPGPRALLRAMATIRRATRRAGGARGEHARERRADGARFDVVHAHFGLAALPALAARRGPVVVTLHGNDLFVRRSRLVTRAALPFCALPAAVSRAFSRNLPGAGTGRRVAVLPVGIALERFRPIPRAEARERLGLDPAGPYLLFPHDPARPLKRFDRAREAAGDVPLLTLGAVPPDEVPYWINAANAVLVPSQDEGFGLSVIEALACGVPAFGDARRHPPRRPARDRRARTARSGTRTAGGRRSRRCSRRRSAGRRPRPRSAVLRRPDGRSRRRGVARGGRRTRRSPDGAPGDRPILGGSGAQATALPTDHERTPATHQALAPRRRRRAPPGGPGRRAGGSAHHGRAPGLRSRAAARVRARAAAGRAGAAAEPPVLLADPSVPAGVDPAAAPMRPPAGAAAACAAGSATCAAPAS